MANIVLHICVLLGPLGPSRTVNNAPQKSLASAGQIHSCGKGGGGCLLRWWFYSGSCWWWLSTVALDLMLHLLQQQNGQLMSLLMIPINLWFFCVGSQFPSFFYNVIKTGVIMWIYARSGSLETIPLSHTLLFSIHCRVSSSLPLAPETTASVLILYDTERKGLCQVRGALEMIHTAGRHSA